MLKPGDVLQVRSGGGGGWGPAEERTAEARERDKSLGDPELRHFNVTQGHATSRDLKTWEHRGTTFAPAEGPAWDDCTTWTGSVRHKLGSGLAVEARTGIETLDYSVASPNGITLLPPENVHLYGF